LITIPQRKDEAPIIFPTFKSFKVVTSRREKNSPALPTGFCSAAICVATLLGISGDGAVAVEKSAACEFLADAVEDLWDRVGVSMSVVTGKYKNVLLLSDDSQRMVIDKTESGLQGW
jgi:hypothetical protein